jgi:hypothetical protein
MQKKTQTVAESQKTKLDLGFNEVRNSVKHVPCTDGQTEFATFNKWIFKVWKMLTLVAGFFVLAL